MQQTYDFQWKLVPQTFWLKNTSIIDYQLIWPWWVICIPQSLPNDKHNNYQNYYLPCKSKMKTTDNKHMTESDLIVFVGVPCFISRLEWAQRPSASAVQSQGRLELAAEPKPCPGGTKQDWDTTRDWLNRTFITAIMATPVGFPANFPLSMDIRKGSVQATQVLVVLLFFSWDLKGNFACMLVSDDFPGADQICMVIQSQKPCCKSMA